MYAASAWVCAQAPVEQAALMHVLLTAAAAEQCAKGFNVFIAMRKRPRMLKT